MSEREFSTFACGDDCPECNAVQQDLNKVIGQFSQLSAESRVLVAMIEEKCTPEAIAKQAEVVKLLT